MDKDTGITGICRIPGLKLKSFSLKLTERPCEGREGCLYCGMQVKYLLEFVSAVTNDPATNRYDLSKLQHALLATQQGTGFKHTLACAETKRHIRSRSSSSH